MPEPCKIILGPFAGTVWRLLPVSSRDIPNAPAKAPEGRFHHSGQVATYTSLSADGAHVAIQRYLKDGIERGLVSMHLQAEYFADFRNDAGASIVWQELRSCSIPSPTWTFSDAARQAGAQAMLYSLRSRPELAHAVVFQPECLTFPPGETEIKQSAR